MNDEELLKKYGNPETFSEDLIKLRENYPVQYLIGNVEFYNCFIKVNENCLIPRFETELLVEKVLKELQSRKLENPKIIDLGTGSGCIAIAIKKHFKCQMTAIDINGDALKLAQENAELNNVTIDFQKKAIEDIDLTNYDVIISNPPYVAKNETVSENTKYEPQNAIFAEEEGLYFYKKILDNVSKLEKKPLFIAFEIGYLQGQKLKDYAKFKFLKPNIQIEKDLSNKERYYFQSFD